MNLSWLRKVSLFEKLSGDELDEILKSASEQKFAKNACIVKAEAESGNEFFVIKKGKVKIIRKRPDEEETILAVLGSGDFFGEMSLLDGSVRSADVIAVEPVEALVIGKKSFFQILNEYPSASINLLKVLTGRLRKSDSRIQSSRNINTVGKIATILLTLGDFGGKRRGAGVIIEKVPSIPALAQMASVPKTAVQKVLNDLQKSGYLKSEGKTLQITNYLSFRKMFC